VFASVADEHGMETVGPTTLPIEGARFEWFNNGQAPPDLIVECADLYSGHYGVWGRTAARPGGRVKWSPEKIRTMLAGRDSFLAVGRVNGQLMGYATVVQARSPINADRRINWVTQLVVREGYRNRWVAKRLLNAVWYASNDFAWGLTTPNAYAVRALERVTHRRCDPKLIKRHSEELLEFGIQFVDYIRKADPKLDSRNSIIDTHFPVSLHELPEQLRKVSSAGVPWTIGEIEEGQEWLAFTFGEQPRFRLTSNEYATFLEDCREVASLAYPRAWKALDRKWSSNTDSEVKFIVDSLRLPPGAEILDWGCGEGRHSLGLAAQGYRVLGVDRVPAFIKKAREAAHGIEGNADFLDGDCRTTKLGRSFDGGICLYDVIGSHPNAADNAALLRNLSAHLRADAPVLLSVMNAEITLASLRKSNSSHIVRLSSQPEAIQDLEPSHTMETTGDVFNPRFILYDEETDTYYRREQFSQGRGLPEEVIVPDRRYTMNGIRELCEASGFTVVWSRPVKAGKFASEVSSLQGKELLVLCRRRSDAVSA
jgi:2-polyprenyl-3-methyl-5-hydroxy-6-metoxy-1,4-benzoquinol methylase/GNAT superfamily N-acetyltransferase